MVSGPSRCHNRHALDREPRDHISGLCIRGPAGAAADSGAHACAGIRRLPRCHDNHRHCGCRRSAVLLARGPTRIHNKGEINSTDDVACANGNVSARIASLCLWQYNTWWLRCGRTAGAVTDDCVAGATAAGCTAVVCTVNGPSADEARELASAHPAAGNAVAAANAHVLHVCACWRRGVPWGIATGHCS